MGSILSVYIPRDIRRIKRKLGMVSYQYIVIDAIALADKVSRVPGDLCIMYEDGTIRPITNGDVRKIVKRWKREERIERLKKFFSRFRLI